MTRLSRTVGNLLRQEGPLMFGNIDSILYRIIEHESNRFRHMHQKLHRIIRETRNSSVTIKFGLSIKRINTS